MEKDKPVILDNNKILTEICYTKAHEVYGDILPRVVENRLKKELEAREHSPWRRKWEL